MRFPIIAFRQPIYGVLLPAYGCHRFGRIHSMQRIFTTAPLTKKTPSEKHQNDPTFWSEGGNGNKNMAEPGNQHKSAALEQPARSHDTLWKIRPALPLARQVGAYQDLMKGKLSAFVVLTAMAGYAAAPVSADLTTLFWTTVGTTLCSASANSINQWIEVPYDAQMSRTRNRPLVRHALSPVNAFMFGSATGVLGVSMLATLVNPLTGWLGLANIILYTMIYTPSKRMSIVNTWVGAVVGAIPPLMGWAAATGSLDAGAWVLGGILFAWQFPHFNSLAWTLRADYSKAGYFMASVTKPKLNARVSLRYALLMFPLCYGLSYLDITDQWFAYDSSVVNGYLLYRAYKFWRKPSDKTSRPLFFSSIVHLPLLVILILIHKRRRRQQQQQQESIQQTPVKA